MKICANCGELKDLTEFYRKNTSSDNLQSSCKKCTRERYNTEEGNRKRRIRYRNSEEAREICRKASKRYREKNREKVAEGCRNRWKAIRETVLTRYGGKCECCSEDKLPFLSIDHIDGGGSKERKQLGGTSGVYRKLYKYIEKLPGYRVLCHNCNMAEAFYNGCPHKTGLERIYR